MLAYARIHNESKIPPNVYYTVKELHPFDAMKFVLEQAIYYQYLRITTTTHGDSTDIETGGYTVDTLYKTCKFYRDQLALSYERNDNLAYLYQEGMILIDDILLMRSDPIDLPAIYAIFNTPPIEKYINREVTPTITVTFLDIFFYIYKGMCRDEFKTVKEDQQYKFGEIIGCPIYIPSTRLSITYEPRLAPENREKAIIVDLSPKTWGTFVFSKDENRSDLKNLLFMYRAKDRTFEELIGILASFSIDHDRYVMTNSEVGYPTLAEICYDMVSGSSYTSSPHTAGTEWARHFFVEMIARGCIRGPKDNELFGELLERTHEDPHVSNFFLKPVELVTVEEATAFRQSDYASVIPDRVMGSMEAADAEVPDESDAAEDDEDETDDTESTDIEEDDVKLEDNTMDEGSSDEDKSAKDKPQIDPKAMLLEISQNDPNLKDYLFRELVATRISMILKNPPANASPNDLLMLKRWKSRWLYLVSVACLRDFLTRVSLRISNV